jgi:5-methylcytosine-specific restriction endonuclease McrA
MSKICKKCGETKPTTEFYKHARKRDGLQPFCKACARLSHAAWCAANPERAKANIDKWVASNREKHNASTAAWFKANPGKRKAYAAKWYAANKENLKSGAVKWNSKNPEKVKAYKAKWSAANKERTRSYSAKWRAANTEKVKARHAANPEARRIYKQNRRARKCANGGRLSPGLAGKLFRLQKGKCACCHVSIADGYHLDHRIPLALDGQNEDLNMQLLCGPCNLSKGAKHPVEFMQSRGFLL